MVLWDSILYCTVDRTVPSRSLPISAVRLSSHRLRVGIVCACVIIMLAVVSALALGYAPAAMQPIRSCHQQRSSAPVATLGRRQAVGAALGLGFVVVSPPAAFASLDPNDMTRFKKALTGVNYLLDNWEVETQECTATGNGVCTDSPDKVRYYFGLRTTDHPLFQLDKLYAKAQQKLPDDVDFDQWIEATEGLQSQIAKINELAYTSSFGEYNPGGGKEQVRKYLLLCKEQVEGTKVSLETIVKLLKI